MAFWSEANNLTRNACPTPKTAITVIAALPLGNDDARISAGTTYSSNVNATKAIEPLKPTVSEIQPARNPTNGCMSFER